MRSILKFKLPEDKQDFFDAVNGTKYKSILLEMDEYLRQQIKYQDREDLQEVRNRLTDLLSEHNLNIYEEFS